MGIDQLTWWHKRDMITTVKPLRPNSITLSC